MMTVAHLIVLLFLEAPILRKPPPAFSEPPHLLHLQFTSGVAAPAGGTCAGRVAPPFDPDGGRGTAARKEAIRRAVQRLYADFDLTVTLSAPTSEHLTILVSSADGTWCNPTYGSRIGGIAPINCAGDGRWGTTGYVFSCRDVATCSIRIAQESAHLLGLDHSADPSDVMFPAESGRTARFRDRPIKTPSPVCGRAFQNSHSVLALRLGSARVPARARTNEVRR